ncbi:hypothetical protein QOT17_003670 [Balamuthia mandrillaris]
MESSRSEVEGGRRDEEGNKGPNRRPEMKGGYFTKRGDNDGFGQAFGTTEITMEDLFGEWETIPIHPDRNQERPLFSPPPLDFFGLASTEEEKGWLDSNSGSFARWFEDLDPPQPSRPPSFEMDVEARYSPRSSVEYLLEELMLEREALENSKKTMVEPPSTLSLPAWASWIQPNSFVGRVPAIGSGLHFLTARGRRKPAAGTKRKTGEAEERKQNEAQKRGRQECKQEKKKSGREQHVGPSLDQ